MSGRPTTRELTDREYEALAGFRRAIRTFLHFSDEAAHAEGLAPSQHQLLLAVRGWPRAAAPSISDIAEALQLRHHSAVGLIHRAEHVGLVTLTRDQADRRVQRLALTDDGHGTLATLSVRHREELRRSRQVLTDLLDVFD